MAMKWSCLLMVLMLAIAMGGRVSLAAGENSSSIPATLGHELRELVAKAGNFLSTAGRAGADGWHAGAATEVDAHRRSRGRRGGGRGGRKELKKAAVDCIPSDMCRRKKVLCGKRCYRSRASLSHYPSNRCVVRCKKCVPTC